MVMKTIDYTSVDGSLLRGVVRLTNHELADHDRSRYSRGELTPFSERGGVVRLTNHELASRRRSRLSRRELTPLGQGGRTILSEDVAGVEVAVEVEVIVD
jgi:hypothetical protein